ncbi:GntR family transcriptional regulator [Pseudarthrobacter sp. NamE5]|uniref:GntR family transcriptional regulator n=1 Tax=Pseudarthrobacter sp. NamE5 TaxID=2576839 RepID=UPI001487102F|nr:GntR family transcriptional regulator [Pseudarthrobacter sp. NamE5]
MEPRLTQTDEALQKIRSRIIDLTMAPGSRIDEPLLLSDFGLGRTPAREAINRLVAEGFVNVLPNRGGTFVRKLDLEEIGQIVVAHQLAENVLGQLCNLDDESMADDLMDIQNRYEKAVKKLDYLLITALNEDFHLRIHSSMGNSFFFDFAQSTHRHVRRLNVHLYKLESAEPQARDEQFSRNLREHELIIDAVRKKDRSVLTSLLPQHARGTQDRLVRILQSKSVPGFSVETRLADMLASGFSKE